MLVSALLVASLGLGPCAIVPSGLKLQDEQPSRCVEYGHYPLTRRESLVVFGLEATDHHPYDDFAHRVFAGLLVRSVKGSAVLRDRQELTSELIHSGIVGEFHGITLGAPRRIRISGRRLVDVPIYTDLSGTGAISIGVDFFFAIDGQFQTMGSVTTAGSARAGGGWRQEVSSDLFSTESSLFVITRERLARRDDPVKPLKVHCRVRRAEYRIVNGSLSQIGKLSSAQWERRRTEMKSVSRGMPGLLPCCAGCHIEDGLGLSESAKDRRTDREL